MAIASSVRWLAERKAYAAAQAASGDEGIFHGQYSGICRVPNGQRSKALDLQGFREAAEGTRTLDLLHGKQTL
jgi:hypothetical protein